MENVTQKSTIPNINQQHCYLDSTVSANSRFQAISRMGDQSCDNLKGTDGVGSQDSVGVKRRPVFLRIKVRTKGNSWNSAAARLQVDKDLGSADVETDKLKGSVRIAERKLENERILRESTAKVLSHDLEINEAIMQETSQAQTRILEGARLLCDMATSLAPACINAVEEKYEISEMDKRIEEAEKELKEETRRRVSMEDELVEILVKKNSPRGNEVLGKIIGFVWTNGVGLLQSARVRGMGIIRSLRISMGKYFR